MGDMPPPLLQDTVNGMPHPPFPGGFSLILACVPSLVQPDARARADSGGRVAHRGEGGPRRPWRRGGRG